MGESEYLTERAGRCVCKLCGGNLEKKVVVYNKYGGSGLELYCPNCQKIEYGTEPEIYNLASEFVETVEFDYFPDMDDEDRHQKLNVAKVCDILGWIYRRTGVLDKTGLHKDSLAEFE